MDTPAQTSITSTFAKMEEQRKLQKNEPRLGNFFAVIYVMITTIIIAYGALFGPAAIVLLYAIWFSKLTYKGVFLLRPSKDVIFALLLPALAVLSVAWSDYPSNTAKSSMEYASMIACVIIMSRIVRTSALVRGVVLGITIALIASLISNQYGLDPMTGQSSLIGLFGSKNMIGVFAEIGILLSLLSLYIRQHFVEKIIFALIPIAICAISLFLSKSASSVLTLALTLSVVFAAAFISRLPRAFRMITLAGFSVLAIVIVVVGTAYDAQDVVLKSFGKNSSLTGRTYLWAEGIKAGMQTPVLGHGYAAFWVEGRPKAELLWQKFAVPAKIGFHFHNLFIETFVELGALGALLIASLMLISCWKSLRLIIRHGMSVEYVYALIISFMFLIRAMVEVDIIGTFNIGSLLFFSVMPRLASIHRERGFVTKQAHSGT